jgi:long-subunit acyl-CoA synthetase (AMP-forming)
MILVPELLKVWTLYLLATKQRAPGSLRFVAVGGAHVDPALIMQARQAGIPAYEGYGLTECGSVVSLNRPGDEGTGVGRVLPHVHLRLDHGEVHLQTSAFLGYTASPALPAPAEHEFATGDLGELDAHGHLHLMGRSKNLLISSFGRNISPEWVESVLLAQSAILQAVVLGDARPWLAAVIVPMPGVTQAQVDAAITHANAQLPDYARIQRRLISAPMTLANGLATGNGRPMRSAIARHFAQAIDSLYCLDESTTP